METQSTDVKELAAALSKAQGMMSHAKKDADNPFYNSKYADLSQVWDTIKEPLHKNGLSVVQTTDWTLQDGTTLITTLMHSSGQWIRGRYHIKPGMLTKDGVFKDNPSPQGVGSAITYARRYALQAIVGLATEDDDGNEASGVRDRDSEPKGRSYEPKVSAPKPAKAIGPLDSVYKTATANGYSITEVNTYFKDVLKVESPSKVNKAQVDAALAVFGMSKAIKEGDKDL